MMVLSASSVNAYLNYDDAYFYVKRQAIFLVVGVIGAIVLIMRLPHAHRSGCSAGSGSPSPPCC